jgi:hypothetical protein
MSSRRSKATYVFGLASLLLAMAGAAWWLGKPQENESAVLENPATQTSAPTPPVVDLAEPAVEFSTFQHVVETGGCEITRPIAIEWLDHHSRTLVPPGPSETSAILAMVTQGGHPAWDAGYRQHLFNSAFNALHLTGSAETLTRALHHLVIHDTDRVMRLYALQHLNAQRHIGHLPDGPLADEIHAMLQEIARSSEEECSGYAIQVLVTWQGGTTIDPSLQQLALATAADASRPVDVRVTAIHAAGPASLPLARTLATQAAEHVLLRKAAIALIGAHGTDEDFPSLETLRRESSRLAQAAEPALLAIRGRLANPDSPAPLPF